MSEAEMGDEYHDPCEYNPLYRRPAFEGDVHAEADVILGSKGDWRLCWSCASLPEFRRYKVRKAIREKR